MKSFLILFKTKSIPFSSNKKIEYVKDWGNYLEKLKKMVILTDYSFLKKDCTYISDKKVQKKSYIPHKDIFSGYIVIKSNNTNEVIDICSSCPVFKRGGDMQIKEIDNDYLELTKQ